MREGVSVAARPVPNQATTRITGFDEHPWIAVDGKNGACPEHDEVARAVNVEVRQVSIAYEREVALIFVIKHNKKVLPCLPDGFSVVAHVSAAFPTACGVAPRLSFPIAKVYHKPAAHV